MKFVHNHSEAVAHLWANKVQPEARMPRRTGMHGGAKAAQAFFEGDTYYSYGHHYVIGHHLPGGYVAINRCKNSSTTNRHVHEAWLATRHLKQLKVYNPRGSAPDLVATHAELDRLLALAAKAKPDGNRPRWLQEAYSLVEDFNTFAKVLKSRTRIKQIDPQAWDAKKHAEALAHQERQEKAREKLRLEHLKEAQGQQVADWRAGRIDFYPSGLPTALRLVYCSGLSSRFGTVGADYWVVETSRRAQIPVEDAKRLWPVILGVKASELDQAFKRPLGDYRLDLIRADGSIRVGCHDIAFNEIEGIAHQLGLTDTSEAQRAFDGLLNVGEQA
jgi:hypothetical protein